MLHTIGVFACTRLMHYRGPGHPHLSWLCRERPVARYFWTILAVTRLGVALHALLCGHFFCNHPGAGWANDQRWSEIFHLLDPVELYFGDLVLLHCDMGHFPSTKNLQEVFKRSASHSGQPTSKIGASDVVAVDSQLPHLGVGLLGLLDIDQSLVGFENASELRFDY